MSWPFRGRSVAVRPGTPSATALIAAVCAAVAEVASGVAGAGDGPVDVLDTLVVTGTRGERRLLDVPVRTEIVTRSEIERTHARDVAEALEHRPGILLRDIHGQSGTGVSLPSSGCRAGTRSRGSRRACGASRPASAPRPWARP